MDLKYITPTQTLDVVYEGQKRTFSLQSVSTSADESEDPTQSLSQALQGIRLSNEGRAWTVGWDTIVTIIDGDEHEEKVMPIVLLKSMTKLKRRATFRLYLKALKLRHQKHTVAWEVLTSRSPRYAISLRSHSPVPNSSVTLVCSEPLAPAFTFS